MAQAQEPERRRSSRSRVCFVVQLTTADGRERAGVVRDASESGVFLLTRAAVVGVGDVVELELVPLQDGDPIPRVRGRVVRMAPWVEGDLWRVGVGVRLEGDWRPDLRLAGVTVLPAP